MNIIQERSVSFHVGQLFFRPASRLIRDLGKNLVDAIHMQKDTLARLRCVLLSNHAACFGFCPDTKLPCSRMHMR